MSTEETPMHRQFLKLVWAWPCGHEVQPDEAQCMRCLKKKAGV